MLFVVVVLDGLFWIGIDGVGFYYYFGGNWKYYGCDNGLMNFYVLFVGVNMYGDVWVSDFWWGGFY